MIIRSTLSANTMLDILIDKLVVDGWIVKVYLKGTYSVKGKLFFSYAI